MATKIEWTQFHSMADNSKRLHSKSSGFLPVKSIHSRTSRSFLELLQ